MEPNSSKRSNCDEPAPPGTSPPTFPNSPKPLALSKGVENAKKRLRAFSIQKKKTPLSPIVPKPINTGTTTVLIGKLSGVKPTTPKIEEDPLKKLPKPPKPGSARKLIQESYSIQQKRTLSEIEDMKRKMELVDLGIPLGLICPSSSDEKAMPTKAMPPIKTFLGRRFRVYTAPPEYRPARTTRIRIRKAYHPAKVDELIREAKKAKVEGREFKFDYQKILPDYDNPFQRKREDAEKEQKYDRRRSGSEKRDRKFEKHDFRRYFDYRKDDRDKYKERDKDKSKERSRNIKESEEKEADVNLKDFLVCDSWSENDDKITSSSPIGEETENVTVTKSPDKKEQVNKKPEKTEKIVINISKEPSQHFKECLTKKVEVVSEPIVDNSKKKKPVVKKLQPVLDCFKFEIDPNDDEMLDIFDESSGLEKYCQVTQKERSSSFYVPPGKSSYESTKDMSMDGMNDDTFLESVINEIRQDDNMCDETSQDKRLVEYDESPNKDDYDSPVAKGAKERKRFSVTPELDEKMIEKSRHRAEFNRKDSLKQSGYLDRKEQRIQRIDYSEEKEQISQRSDYSDRKDSGSQRSDYSDRKDSSSQRSDYSDRKDSGSQRSDYSDRKDSGSQRSDYTDRKDSSSQRSDYSDRKDSGSQRSDYSDRKDSISQRSDYSDRKDSGSQRSYYSDKKDRSSQRSNYSDGQQSTESGYKTSDTNKSDKYVDNFRLSVEKELDEALEKSMNRCTVESLETWSFVLKICQPLLFRHDKNKCYRETTVSPKLWYTENPKVCSCVKDRAIVYEELEMLKMGLVDRVYGCDQLAATPSVNARAWYPRSAACLAEGKVQPVAVDWEADDSQTGAPPEDRRRSPTPQREDEIMLDREYQRFMEAVWPDVAEAKASETSRSTTPVQQDRRKTEGDTEREAEDKKTKKIKLSSEGWSQESDIEQEPEKNKKIKMKEKKSRKRKRSPSTLSPSSSDSDSSSKKKKKMMKSKALKKAKSKEAQRRRMGKKLLKKLKEKQKQKKKIDKEESEELEIEEVKKKELKKSKKKKQQKTKKKSQKRRRKASSSSSASSGSGSEPDARPGKPKKRKRTEGKKKRRDKRMRSSSESHSEDLFDVNILNNIKTERLTDDEKCQKLMEFSPRIHHKPREIINVKELQNDFVGNNIHIKKEVEDPKDVTEEIVEAVEMEKPEEELTQLESQELTVTDLENSDIIVPLPVSPPAVEELIEKDEIKAIPVELSANQVIHIPEPQDTVAPAVPSRIVDESNLSQCSSQESVCSTKESSSYEKDESHLRPSSQNSNYSFNDVIASQSALYHKTIETIVDSQEKYGEGYEHEPGNYEMYEQLAMAYQSDVANLLMSQASRPDVGVGVGVVPQRIETVVRTRARGEIKCDWRADHPPAAPPANRPSRWGLKPSEVNIVLTGGEPEPPPPAPPLPSPQPVYRIQSLAKRTEVAADYDEAYMDMYGASDRLQYGDCFATDARIAPPPAVTDITLVPMPASPEKDTPQPETRITLDARIDQALREAVLSEMAAAAKAAEEQKDSPEKGILVTAVGGVVGGAMRGGKRVSFADGYQPGQDSDLEEPPVKKRRKVRRGRAGRTGCAWPCPAAHPDHVPLWDALPPPPPPPGDPPRSCRLAVRRRAPDQGILGGFMPPEPPPGLISF